MSPTLQAPDKGEPYYWNFLEMEFNPQKPEPTIGIRIRNLIDPPSETPRGGGSLEIPVSQTGRTTFSKVAGFKTLPSADVRFSDTSGKPILATRSAEDGSVRAQAMIDIESGSTVIATAFDGAKVESKTFITS